jgi:hypothetical protein
MGPSASYLDGMEPDTRGPDAMEPDAEPEV